MLFFVSAPCAVSAQTLTPTPTASTEIFWEQLSPGFEESHFHLASNTLLSSSVVAVRVSLDQYTPRVVRAAEYGWKKATTRALCKSSGASVCINSNFFDEQGKPLGVVISRGIQHQKAHNGGNTLTGIFFVTADGVGITHRGNFSADRVIEAAQAGPRLISEGAPVIGVKDSSIPTNLSLACLDRLNRLLLLRVSLAMFGGSLREIQATLLRPEIGCYEALNLDGGGSSQMYISSKISGHAGATREEELPGRDEVPVALGLFPKP